MRKIRPTTKFKRDYRREKSGQHGGKLETPLAEVIDILAIDGTLPSRNRDHALTGQWTDYRDCHLRPDLILIYRKPDEDWLELVRLGSHSELGF